MDYSWSLKARWIGRNQTEVQLPTFRRFLRWTAYTQGQPIAGPSHRDQTIVVSEKLQAQFKVSTVSSLDLTCTPESGRRLLRYQCELATGSCSPRSFFTDGVSRTAQGPYQPKRQQTECQIPQIDKFINL